MARIISFLGILILFIIMNGCDEDEGAKLRSENERLKAEIVKSESRNENQDSKKKEPSSNRVHQESLPFEITSKTDAGLAAVGIWINSNPTNTTREIMVGWNRFEFFDDGTGLHFRARPTSDDWGESEPCNWIPISGRYYNTGNRYFGISIRCFADRPLIFEDSKTARLFDTDGSLLAIFHKGETDPFEPAEPKALAARERNSKNITSGISGKPRDISINELVAKYGLINKGKMPNQFTDEDLLIQFEATFNHVDRARRELMAHSDGWVRGSRLRVVYAGTELEEHFTMYDPQCCDNRYKVIGLTKYGRGWPESIYPRGDLYVKATSIEVIQH